MPETREERKARDLRLADLMERHIVEMQELVAQYIFAGGKVPEDWEEDLGALSETRQLISRLRGEEPKNAV